MDETKQGIELIPVNIIKDSKQTSIRIPADVVDILEINSKTDIFLFAFDRKNLTLEGSLEDKKVLQEEFENGNTKEKINQ